MMFTAEELAELAAFDAAIDADVEIDVPDSDLLDDAIKREKIRSLTQQIATEKASWHFGDRKIRGDDAFRMHTNRLKSLRNRLRYMTDTEYREHVKAYYRNRPHAPYDPVKRHETYIKKRDRIRAIRKNLDDRRQTDAT